VQFSLLVLFPPRRFEAKENRVTLSTLLLPVKLEPLFLRYAISPSLYNLRRKRQTVGNDTPQAYMGRNFFFT
jgi:hypothetical protein